MSPLDQRNSIDPNQQAQPLRGQNPFVANRRQDAYQIMQQIQNVAYGLGE